MDEGSHFVMLNNFVIVLEAKYQALLLLMPTKITSAFQNTANRMI